MSHLIIAELKESYLLKLRMLFASLLTELFFKTVVATGRSQLFI